MSEKKFCPNGNVVRKNGWYCRCRCFVNEVANRMVEEMRKDLYCNKVLDKTGGSRCVLVNGHEGPCTNSRNYPLPDPQHDVLKESAERVASWPQWKRDEMAAVEAAHEIGADHPQVNFCTREAGHAPPCNGFPRSVRASDGMGVTTCYDPKQKRDYDSTFSAFDAVNIYADAADKCGFKDAVKRARNDGATGDSKPTNPKDAVGSLKARWFSYFPLRVLVGVGLALLEGARKYGRHNYRVAGVRATVYLDACVSGHLMPWAEGEDIDPDSGLNHIDKAIASLIVLRDGIYEGNWVDDRAPSVKDWPKFMADAHAKAREIIARYPDAKEAFTNLNTKTQVGP